MAIRLDGWGRVSGDWVNLLNSLFQVINYHGFLYAFLLDSFEFQGWNRLADDSGFSVDCDEFFVFDLVEVVSLGQIDIVWDEGVASLKLLWKVPDFKPLEVKGFCSHAKGTNAWLLAGFLSHAAWSLKDGLRCSSRDHIVYQYGNGHYASPSARIVNSPSGCESSAAEERLWISHCPVPRYTATDDNGWLVRRIED